MKYIFHKKDFDRRLVYSRGILIARKWIIIIEVVSVCDARLILTRPGRPGLYIPTAPARGTASYHQRAGTFLCLLAPPLPRPLPPFPRPDMIIIIIVVG